MSTLPPTTGRPTNHSTPPAAERFCPNGLAGDVPREGTLLETLRWRVVVLALCLLCDCAAPTTPSDESCEVRPDATYALTESGGAQKTSTLRDALGACSAAPTETCDGNVYTVACNGVTMTWTVTSARGAQPMSLTLDTDSAGQTDHAEFAAAMVVR